MFTLKGLVVIPPLFCAIFVRMNNKYLLVLGFCAVFVLSLLLGLSHRQNRGLREELQASNYTITALRQGEATRLNTLGESVTQINTITGELSLLKLALGKDREVIEKRFGELKNIKAYVESGITASGKFYTQITDSLISDTQHVKVFAYSDGYMNISCNVLADSALCEYMYRDTFFVAVRLNENWKWYQIAKRSRLKRQGYSKYTPVTEVTCGNNKVQPYSVKSFLQQ